MYYEYINSMKEGYDLYRKGDYEKSFAIFEADHFGTGKTSALKKR